MDGHTLYPHTNVLHFKYVDKTLKISKCREIGIKTMTSYITDNEYIFESPHSETKLNIHESLTS